MRKHILVVDSTVYLASLVQVPQDHLVREERVEIHHLGRCLFVLAALALSQVL
ncbi:hypothetical protein RSG32_001421 [Yersinia enterocolitica]|nr:hypothetical protein [Yersinia enterocolitica]